MAGPEPWLLATMVVGGVALVVWVTHLTGGTHDASLADEDAARAQWSADHDAAVCAIRRDDRAAVALLELEDGTVGLVFAVGDRFATRHLRPGHAIRRIRTVPDGLVFTLPDFGAPAVRVRLTDPAARSYWRARVLEVP